VVVNSPNDNQFSDMLQQACKQHQAGQLQAAEYLAFHATDRVVKSPSASQVRQPLYSSSVGAWRRYEKHLQPLIDGLAG